MRCTPAKIALHVVIFVVVIHQTNYRKSVDQLSALLQVLNCDVDLVVRAKTA